MKCLNAVLATALALALIACSKEASSDSPAPSESQAAATNSAASMTNDPNNPYGTAEMQMHERMMAATGANPSETWVKKMIVHHQGAIDMSEIIIREGGDPKVVAIARRAADMQRKEIKELEGLLAGTSGTAVAPPKAKAPTVTPVAKAAREPAPPAKAGPAPKAAEAADPHAGHDMSKMPPE